MGVHIILTMFIACFGLTPVLSSDQMGKKAANNDVNHIGRIQENFRNFFDSITKNDVKKIDTYHSILEQEAVREQQAFNVLKGELQFARQKNAYKQNDFYNEGIPMGQEVVLLKREANVTSTESNKTKGGLIRRKLNQWIRGGLIWRKFNEWRGRCRDKFQGCRTIVRMWLKLQNPEEQIEATDPGFQSMQSKFDQFLQVDTDTLANKFDEFRKSGVFKNQALGRMYDMCAHTLGNSTNMINEMKKQVHQLNDFYKKMNVSNT